MDDLAQRVEDIRTSAARFYAVDLHLHSPMSPDWDNSGTIDDPRDPALDRVKPGVPAPVGSVAAYTRLVEDSGRELAAVTDHNVSSYGEAVSNACADAGVCVLPGMELTVAFSDAPLIRDLRIHVVVVFPPGTHQGVFERILPAGTLAEGARDPHGTLTYKSIDHLIKSVHDEGGLVVAAHVESETGLRGVYTFGTKLLLEPIGGTPEARAVLQRLGDQVKDELVKFDAIQVKKNTDANHYMTADGTLRVPLIVASDCHGPACMSPKDVSGCSSVKMSKASFSGLVDALKFPDLRIRHQPRLALGKPPRLLGLRLVGKKATDKTFFDDTILGLSDNLTCVIGPRGSGKSAAIDALRYLMGYNRTLDEIGRSSRQVRERQAHTLQNTRIEALYQTADGSIYRLSATYDPDEDYTTEVYDAAGSKVNIADVQECGEFPLNLFGWGELELLAENPESQRELLDQFIPSVCELKDRKDELHRTLSANRRSLLGVAEELQTFFSDVAKDFRRVNELKARFDELNTAEIEGHFKELDELKKKRALVRTVSGRLEDALDEGGLAAPLRIVDLLGDEDLRDWALELGATLKAEAIDSWIADANESFELLINAAIAIVDAEDAILTAKQEKAEQDIRDVIGEEKAITGDLRNKAKTRYELAAANFEAYKLKMSELQTLLADRRTTLDAVAANDGLILSARDGEIARIRDEVSLVEDDDYKIDLVLVPAGDRGQLLSALEGGALQMHGHWKESNRAQVLSDNLLSRELADALMAGDGKRLTGLSTKVRGTDFEIRVDVAERMVNDNSPFSPVDDLEVERVDASRLKRLLLLQEVVIDDEFYITLGGKPIQQCSPGQRCSAMLPVVTLTSSAPLVIDQPEDNLDNRLVSRAMFKILQRLKESRQIVLATHNPNILVSGDAEQVLSLDATGNLECHGCIDDPVIIEAVIGLMEGGAEAFERRHRKYEPYL